jgi:ketosteroid isomerase-like protein
MKKTPLLIWVVVMLMTSCQQKPVTVAVDPEAVKAELATFMDEYNVAYKAMDINKMTAFCTDNALFLGTDPSEFWDKKQITDYFMAQGTDSTMKLEFKVDRREIMVAADGNSAIVVEQFFIPLISTKLQVRCIDKVVKVNDKWMFDFLSWNIVTRNEDIPKLNAALE